MYLKAKLKREEPNKKKKLRGPQFMW